MLQALLTTFREGLESVLIVGVIVTYLRKTGRASLFKGVYVGLGLAAILCAAGAYLWMQLPNQPLVEGVAALVAAALVAAFLVHMVRAARHLKGDIEQAVDRRVGAASAPPSRGALIGVTTLTALLVAREGIEAVLFIGVQTFYAKAVDLAIGACLGLALSGGIAWAWSRYGRRLDLGAVMRVTVVFLSVFLVQLVIYGVHELAESGVIEGSQAFHDATERFGPEGDIGAYIAYSLVLAPILYLIWARRAPPRPSPAT